MSRPFTGLDSVAAALDVLATAKSVEQLRQAQAVVLPLRYGLSLSQTAQALGTSATAPIVRQRDVFAKYAAECSTGNPHSPRAVRAMPAPTSARHR